MNITEVKELRRGQIIYKKNKFNKDGSRQRFRVNGKVKTWKTKLWKIQVPIKRGLAEYGYLNERNMDDFTTVHVIEEGKFYER